MMKFWRKDRKGISMIEVVIAIAVISVITLASITLLTRSIAIEKLNARNAEITSYSESAVECFRFSRDKDEFFSLIKKIDGFIDQDNDAILEDNERIILEKSNYSIAIEINSLYNNILITAIDSDGVSIYSLSYSK